MHTALYRRAAHHAWTLTWQNKSLWIFAFFATFVSKLGLIDMLAHFSTSANIKEQFSLISSIPALVKATLIGLMDAGMGLDTWTWIIWISIFIFTFCLGFFCIAISSQGALIHGITQSIRHPKRQVNLNNAWHSGITHFWRLLFLQAIKYLGILVLTLLLGLCLAVLSDQQSTLSMFFFIICLILSLALGSILSFLASYTAAYIIIEDHSLGEALLHAWDLFRHHILVSLEVALIVLLTNIFIIGFMILNTLLFIFELNVLLGFASFLPPLILQVALMFVALVFVLITLSLAVFLTHFTTSIWTYLFLKMHHHGIASHLLRLFSRN